MYIYRDGVDARGRRRDAGPRGFAPPPKKTKKWFLEVHSKKLFLRSRIPRVGLHLSCRIPAHLVFLFFSSGQSIAF